VTPPREQVGLANPDVAAKPWGLSATPIIESMRYDSYTGFVGGDGCLNLSNNIGMLIGDVLRFSGIGSQMKQHREIVAIWSYWKCDIVGVRR